MDIAGDSLGLFFHHAFEFDAGFIESLRIIGFEKRQHLLAGKLCVDRQRAIRKLDDRVGATRAVSTWRGLQIVHMTRQEIFEQAFEALLAETAAQMRHLEEIVEVVDRLADHAEMFQLLLRSVQMLLALFELREAVLDILIELHLDRVADCRELLIDVRAYACQALPRLVSQSGYLEFERTCQLLSAGRELMFQNGFQTQESVGKTIGAFKTEIAFDLLQTAGDVGAGLSQFFVEAGNGGIEMRGKTRDSRF